MTTTAFSQASQRAAGTETTDDIAAQTAMVIETNNLRGGTGGLPAVCTSMLRILGLLGQQTMPLTKLAQIIITHDGLSEDMCALMRERSGLPLEFAQIEDTTGYYRAKNAGFAATDPARCRYVLFADSDCEPDPDWLANILAPFANQPTLGAVAGRTTYVENLAGTALTSMDFLYFPSPLRPGATRNFFANNVVFRREVFEEHAYKRVLGVYRANCQILGLDLQTAGVALHFAYDAHTHHRLPDTRMEAVKLRWMRGQDTVTLTPHLVRSYLPGWLQWFAHTGPIAPLVVLWCRLFYSLRAFNRQGLPRLRGFTWLGGLGLVLVFSAVDMAGAIARGFGYSTLGHKNEGDNFALSYHATNSH